MSKWILVNIGCIECGVSSKIVGVFSSKERAEELANRLYESHKWRDHGQNDFEVFEHPPLDEVDPEYLKAPK